MGHTSVTCPSCGMETDSDPCQHCGETLSDDRYLYTVEFTERSGDGYDVEGYIVVATSVEEAQRKAERTAPRAVKSDSAHRSTAKEIAQSVINVPLAQAKYDTDAAVDGIQLYP